MKRSLCTLAIGALLGSVVTLALVFGVRDDVRSAVAEGGGAAVSGNGDVNGDGAINISDASYLLNWLFLGGPEPAVCPPSAPSAACIPATGADTCYDTLGNEVACDDPGYPGQDGFYQAGCPNDGRFIVSEGGETVVDNCTGLEWAREPSLNEMTWQQALQYCDSLELDGGGWRAPNYLELVTILNAAEPFALSSEFTPQLGGYWSSSSWVANLERAVVVYFTDLPGPSTYLKSDIRWVRPVRGGL